MKEIEDNSVDLVLTDPPYHLSNTKPIEDRLKEVIGGFNNIIFPNFNKGNIEVGKYSQLVSILCKSSDLRRFKDASIGVESWIGVPESAVDFNSDIIIRQKEINTSTKSASIEISDSELVDKVDTKESQFVGDFILDFGDSIDFPISDLQGCNFGQLLSGLFAVPISSIGLPCTNDLLSNDSAIFGSDDFVEDIGRVDNTFSESERTPFILTSWRAKNGFILRFDLRGASAELLIADSTNQSDLSSQQIRPKLIRTFAGTGCLSTIFKSVNVSLIFSIADRTYSFYFHLWLPPDCINSISQLATTVKGFMGKDWDCMPTVDYWKECYRVLKDGAFAFIMSSPRQDVLSRMIVNLEDAGFVVGFTSIYWCYSSGFPKAGNISKLVDKRLGVEREVIGKAIRIGDKKSYPKNANIENPNKILCYQDIQNLTIPSTPEAKALGGKERRGERGFSKDGQNGAHRMIMSADDRRQQTKLIKLEHPEYLAGQIYRDLRDVEKSRAWTSVVSCKHFKNHGLDIDEWIDLQKALKSLTIKQREVVILLLSGYNLNEISIKLDKSYRNVLQLKDYAINKMREILCSEM
jgi:hypothetical protein